MVVPFFCMENSKQKKSAGKRPAPISIRLYEERRDEFYALHKASGLSVNTFVMQTVFGNGSTKPVMDKKTLALLLSQAARINGHLEEMGHSSSDSQNFLILEECRHELFEIRAALLAGMRGNAPGVRG